MRIAREPVKPDRSDPTPHQLEVYSWLYEEACRRGYQPSYREVMERFGWSSINSMFTVVMRPLVRRGYLQFPGKGSRSIRFLKRPDGRPFLGFVSLEAVPDPPDEEP